METLVHPPTETDHIEHVAREESVAGFVLGIAAILFAWFPILGLASGIVGMILSVKGKTRVGAPTYRKLGATGLILGIIGTVLSGAALLMLITMALGGHYSWYYTPGNIGMG